MNRPSTPAPPSQEWDCRAFGRVLAPFLDGELDAAGIVDAEAHLQTCDTCRERVHLGRAVRGTLKEVTRTETPLGLRDRLAVAMAAEQARGETRSRSAAVGLRRFGGMRTMMPLAGAAAVGVAVFGLRGNLGPVSSLANRLGLHVTTSQGSLTDNTLAELVAQHARPLPPEQTDPKKVRALEQYVGVPVHPVRLGGGARLVGGRVLPMHRERAAMLQYELGSGNDTRRVSVFIYDPRRIQVNEEDLAPRAIGTASVRVGRAQGYSVAVAQHGGVDYAVVSDMDEQGSAQLAALVDDGEGGQPLE